MTLLDRFRSQPPQKHPDAAVRLAFVAGLPVADRSTLTVVAREDPEPRIRRAAVAKLLDTEALGDVARSDTDESVRTTAVAMLRDIAVEAFEGIGEAESLAALAVLEAIDEPRAIVHVARTSGRESVAQHAVARLADHRQLGSVARHAIAAGARTGALDVLRAGGDTAELLAVALHGEFKDTAAAAVDGLTARRDLEQVAARARNRNAVKRARAILREMDERAARDAAEQAAAAAEATRVAATAHAKEVSVSMSSDAPETPTSQPSASTPFADERSVPPTEAAPTPSFEMASPEPEMAPPEPAAGSAPDSASAAPGSVALTAVPVAETGGGDVAPPEAAGPEAIAAESADATSAGDAIEAAAGRQARLAALADAAAAAADSADVAQARATLGTLRREWTHLLSGGGLAPVEAVAARFAEAESRITAREAAAHDADVRTRREGLGRMHNLLGRVEQLAARTDLSLKAADRALRDVRAAMAGIPPLPSRADYEDVHTRLKTVQDALAPRVHEMREADEWRKWSNVTIQEQLCAKMEALGASEDAEAIAREVRTLQQQWREAADVPRDKADALWRRFKTAHDTVWARCEAHFAAEAQARADNLARKTALCDQAEALADSTSWIQAAEAIKKLQAEWKAIGPVSRGREKAVWDRFRTACDRFFTRRNADLAERKNVWGENLAKKEALCARAETLADSTDWDAAASEVKRLQADWKTIGPVKKSRSEALWRRFRGACDKFFERYANRHTTARAERVAAREAICAELEALVAANEGADAPADLLSTVRSLRSRWQAEIAARGVDPDRARALDGRFADALAALSVRWPAALAGSDLDPDANRKRMEGLVKKVEELAGSVAGAAAGRGELSPVNKLAAMLKEALAANTIGGKADDDSRWRALAEDVRQAQAAWARLGPVADADRRPLADRFQRAVRRVMDRVEASGRGGGRPVPPRPSGPPRGRDPRPKPAAPRAPEPAAEPAAETPS